MSDKTTAGPRKWIGMLYAPEPHHGIEVVVTGEIDADLLDAVCDWADRQRRRLTGANLDVEKRIAEAATETAT